MIPALLVGIGGVAGALLRFAVDTSIESYRARRRRQALPLRVPFPAGTLAVNTVGSLLIGLCGGLLQHSAVGPQEYAVYAAGLAGGLTTFSTLSVAAITLWRGRRPGAAVVHLASNLALGLGAAWLGLAITGAV